MSYNDFSLVLSGGGALGFAHLGIIEDLSDNGLIPSEIIGTSMGGIIGSLLAIGLPYNEIENRFKSMSGFNKWVSFSLSGNGMVQLNKLENMLQKTFQDRMMSDVSIPLKIIATNFENGEKTVFSQDNNIKIIDAVLATIAIPGIFPARMIEGKPYIDGAFTENLGITEASHEVVLASDVMGKRSFKPINTPKPFKIQNFMDNFEKTMRIMMTNQTTKNLSACKDKSVFLIEPNTRNFRTFHFNKFNKIKNVGKNEIDKFVEFIRNYNNDFNN